MRSPFLITLALLSLAACTPSKKGQRHVSRIMFSSHGCFGTCPVMNVDIEENGNFYFQGKYYTQKTGFFHASNQQATFVKLRDILRSYDLDSLKANYAVSVTDQADYRLKIYYDNQAVTTHVYGSGLEPRQITVLIDSLERLYKSIPLTPDTTAHDYRMGTEVYRQHIDFRPPASSPDK
jgi:hypothetical protein